MPEMLDKGCMTERRTSRNSVRRGRMREGMRSVKTRRDDDIEGTGCCGGGIPSVQAQTTLWGLPLKSNETQVHPDSSSLVMADQ